MEKDLIKQIKKFLNGDQNTFYIECDGVIYVCINGKLTCFTDVKNKQIYIHGDAEVYYVATLGEFIKTYRGLQHVNSN